jgi:hypothetical protein
MGTQGKERQLSIIELVRQGGQVVSQGDTFAAYVVELARVS